MLEWTAMPRNQADPRDVVLVCADEPLGSALAELARAHGYEPRVSVAPLQAIQTLLAAGGRVRNALISSALRHDWGRALHEFLADEYPEVDRVMLTA